MLIHENRENSNDNELFSSNSGNETTETPSDTREIAVNTEAPISSDSSKRQCDANSIPDEKTPHHIPITQGNTEISDSENKNENSLEQKELSFCNALSKTGTCIYGSGCKFIHDENTYLKSKPADIGCTCVLIEKYNHCPYGIQCRFFSGHQKIDNNAGSTSTPSDNVLNTTTSAFLKHVRMVARTVRQKGIQKKTSTEKSASSDEKQKNSHDDQNQKNENEKKILGAVGDREKPTIDFFGKKILAPLTTAGNLPFRRICKEFGADITCGEMAIVHKLLEGNQSEWALMKRHVSEDVFGVQLTGSSPEQVAAAVRIITRDMSVDYIDINAACPTDLIWNNKCGAYLMNKPLILGKIVKSASSMCNIPITVKLRTGVDTGKNTAHRLIGSLQNAGASGIFIHGRSRQQRYSKLADWEYISECVSAAKETTPVSNLAIIGNGDILTWEDYYEKKALSQCDSIMVARGALIKPWIFKEIDEKKAWDISANERLDVVRQYAKYGLEHFGSDSKGVETTRKFLLEWLSFLHRYVPVGIVEQRYPSINERPPALVYRSDLEQLLSSQDPNDWIKITSMFLGKPPVGFRFSPKHGSR